MADRSGIETQVEMLLDVSLDTDSDQKHICYTLH